jgi:hypothetical protein
MSSIRSSSSLLRKSHIANHAQVVGIFRALHISQWQSEPHQQNQNPCKRSYPQTLKTMTNTLLDRSGSPVCTWLLCLMQVSVLFLKLTYNLTLGGIQLHCAEGSTRDKSLTVLHRFDLRSANLWIQLMERICLSPLASSNQYKCNMRLSKTRRRAHD